MKKLHFLLLFVFIFLSTSISLQVNAQSKNVPGIVVNHIPASTETYIGSPSICILPNGDYIASHEYFGPGSTEDKITVVYKSTNRGRSWEKISEIKGQVWSNLFVHQNALYIMGVGGTGKGDRNFIIRGSLDEGSTWSEPIDCKNGLLLEGQYHTGSMPVIVNNGRLWRALENTMPNPLYSERYSAMVISAPIDADLLDASNWLATNSLYLPYNSPYAVEGKFRRWLEGNVVVTPEDKLVNILRVNPSEEGREVAAVVNISNDGLESTFDPSTGFMDFIGGAKKFSIRYDEKSKRYWTLANMIRDECLHLPPEDVRNTLVLESSLELKNWTVHEILLQHPDVFKHAFQYVDWQFEGRDIIFLSRTAYDDEFGGAHNFHDANYLTFHRIINFRSLVEKNIEKKIN